MIFSATGFISWSLSTGHFNRTDWFTLLFLDLIEFGLIPDIDPTFNMTPVDLCSRFIVEIGESTETSKRTVNLPTTHKVTFQTIWTEICQQRNVEPHYLNIIEWRWKLHERLKTNPQLLPGLFLFSNALRDDISGNLTIAIDDECDLNISMFVKALLRSRITNLFT